MKLSNTELKLFALNNAWGKKINSSKDKVTYKEYIDPDMADLVMVISQNTGSDALDLSNFAVALERLGGWSKDVILKRSEHWAGSWIEVILVNPKSSKLLQLAYQISQDLKELQVLDENDYLLREETLYQGIALEASIILVDALVKHFGVVKCKALVELAAILNFQSQQVFGTGHILSLSADNVPTAIEVQKLRDCMSQLSYHYTDKTDKCFISHVFHNLETKLGHYDQKMAINKQNLAYKM